MIMQWINYFKVSKFLKKASAAGTPQEAFHILNGIFESSYFTGNYRVWKSTWQTFGQIATQAGEPDLANDCFIAADSWNNPKLLYQCGYNLFERGLFSASVPLYERGLKLLPNDENMLLELVSSLEELGKFNLAKEQLLKVPRILEVSFVPRYLMAYYSIILLDIPAAKKWFEGLDKLMSENGEEYESYKLMHDRIKNILKRIEILSAFTPLDKHDIRGWNAALNANILLNLSEFGEEMNGRYAFLQEGPGLVFECIHKLQHLLTFLKYAPERILTFPDRDSRILAQMTSEIINCPVEEYSEATKTMPGLIVCYNFNSESVSNEMRNLTLDVSENQFLWCHTFDWTKDSIAPDIISYFAQYSTAAWDKQMVIENMHDDMPVGDTPKMIELPALEGSYDEIAKKLQTLIEKPIQEEACPILRQFAECLFSGDENSTCVFSRKRTRSKQFSASPVESSRFF